jgi:hypothetical protein
MWNYTKIQKTALNNNIASKSIIAHVPKILYNCSHLCTTIVDIFKLHKSYIQTPRATTQPVDYIHDRRPWVDGLLPRSEIHHPLRRRHCWWPKGEGGSTGADTDTSSGSLVVMLEIDWRGHCRKSQVLLSKYSEVGNLYKVAPAPPRSTEIARASGESSAGALRRVAPAPPRSTEIARAACLSSGSTGADTETSSGSASVMAVVRSVRPLGRTSTTLLSEASSVLGRMGRVWDTGAAAATASRVAQVMEVAYFIVMNCLGRCSATSKR